MKTIVICEKPNQAKNLRAALGDAFGPILAARGHLLRLEEPQEVNPAWRKWGFDLLKPDGVFFGVRPRDDAGPALQRIRDALRGADRAIVATDCDREGEMIGREILDHFAFRGEILRAIFSAEDPATLRKSFENLRPSSEFDALYAAARARATMDQMSNLSLTRAISCGFAPPGWKGPIGVGRVKTPTLALVVRREREITGFRAEAYFEVSMTVLPSAAGGAATLWRRGSGETRIMDQAKAKALEAAARSWSGPLRVASGRKASKPPRLPHLTALQAAAGKWGWSAEKTLETAQALYDVHKVATYPRSDGKHLPEAQIPLAAPTLAGLAQIAEFAGIVPAEPVIRRGASGAFSDKALEGSSHHAIIPNPAVAADFGTLTAKLSKDERRLFDLIARSFIAALSPDHEFDETVIEADVGGETFRARGRVVRVAGWKAAFGAAQEEADDEEDDQAFPPVKDGEAARARDAAIAARKTTPPARYDQGALIVAMENAWKYVSDPAERDRLKEVGGIGTGATRAGIISGLLDQRLLIEEKKTLKPSETGMQLFDLVEGVAPSLNDAGETARFEAALELIARGKVPAATIIEIGVQKTGALLDELKAKAGSRSNRLEGGGDAPPTPKMLELAKAIAERKKIRLPRLAQKRFRDCKAFLDEHSASASKAG